MSDHSTSSSASSTNSWTILSPEVGAVDALGPGDDGTESLSDAPSLSEDLAGMSVDTRLREHELPVETVLSEELPVETVLSEEGHQVCQETSPDIYEEGPSASAQAVLTSDPEIRPPVIHDTITSSPPDNDDLLGATPFAITESALLLTEEPALSQPLTEELAGSPAPESLVHQSPAPESLIHQSPGPEATIEESSSPESHAPEVTTEVTSLTAHQVSAEESSVVQSPAPEITAEESSPPESPTAEASAEGNSFPQSPAPEVMTDINPAPEVMTDINPAPEVMTDIKPAPEVCPSLDIHSDVSPIPESPPLVPSPSDSPFDFGSTRESPAPETLYPETTGTTPAEEREREETELAEKLTEVVKEPESLGADFGVDRPAVDDGLRLRHATPAVALRRTSDEEDEEEEEVFVPPKRKEEKRSFSLNQLIIGALVLLCLGSLFFSDDSDGVELTDQEVLSKLDQEKKQIAVLEAQLQAQREELDKALKMAADSATAEKENTKLKEQLSALPGLKEELETLRSRVIELRQLTAEEETPEPTSSSSQPSADSPGEAVVTPPRPDRWQDKKEKLQRQKMLLEQSRRRLEEMKKQGAYKKGVREMVEMQRRLSEQVEQLDKREGRRRKHQEDERKKREGGCEREKKRQGSGCWTRDEMMKRKDEKHGRDKRDGGWKEHDKTSHSREHWKKYRDQWEHKKDERRMERENRKKERPWQASRRQTSPHHQHDRHHHHHHHQQQHHSHQQSQKAQNNKLHSFWRHQEEKLRKNQRPPEGCRGIANCAAAEGFVPVQLAEFQPVLEQYLGKLQGLPSDNEEALRRLVAQFFSGGTFAHDRMSFGEFAEDVADVLEDLADILEDEEWGGSNDALEEEMEEFEKEVLWKFAAATA